MRARFLEEENNALKLEVEELKKENGDLREMMQSLEEKIEKVASSRQWKFMHKNSGQSRVCKQWTNDSLYPSQPSMQLRMLLQSAHFVWVQIKIICMRCTLKCNIDTLFYTSSALLKGSSIMYIIVSFIMPGIDAFIAQKVLQNICCYCWTRL